MPDSYTNLLYHIIFSTKDRRPLITDFYEPRLYEYIGGTIRRLGGICLELNGTEDHVHVLAKLRPDKALSDVLRELKANASGWMHDVFPELNDFSWQRGYGAFTVSQSNVVDVRRYIADQKQHHKRVSFREEFIRFMKANELNTMNAMCRPRKLSPAPPALTLMVTDLGFARRCTPGFTLSPAPRAGMS